MSEIELRYENGDIVAYDSNGNKIPVSFEEGEFDSVDTAELYNTHKYADPTNGTQGIQDIIDEYGSSTLIILDSATYEGGQIDLGSHDAIGMVGTSRFIGSDGTRIRLADNTDSALVIGDGASGCYFENIRFDGNKENNSSGDCFHAKTMWNSVWFSCDFRSGSRHGLYLDNSGNGNADDHSTLYCRFNQNANDGLRIESPASRHYYVNSGNNDRGIFVGNGRTSIQIHGAQIYGNTTRGINVGNARRTIISNVHIEGPNTSNIGLDHSSNCQNISVENIYLVNSFDTAVRIKNWGGPSYNAHFDNINVIQGVSPSGTQGSGDINIGFAVDDPNNNGYSKCRMVNCATVVEGTGFGNTAWDVSVTSGLTIDNAYGYQNRVSGTANESDGDDIWADMDEDPIPSKCRVWTQSSNRAYVTGVSGSQIEIALEDPSGSAVNTDEDINYLAVGSTAPTV